MSESEQPPNLLKLSVETGVPYSTLRYRKVNGLPLVESRIQRIEHNGKTLTVRQWADEFGMEAKQLRDALTYRVNTHAMSYEQALADVESSWS